MILTYFDYNDKMQVINVIEVEASDISPMYDTHIVSIESCGGGFWEVWNIGGVLCAYYDEAEE